jgi:AcrR family transcriptional regulator
MTTAATTGTREAILERAVDLASAEGLEGLTIGRLAAEMGMSKSGLFRHFGSKEDLQLATVEAAARRFLAEVIDPALEREPGMERLRALGDLYLDHLEAQVFAGGCFWGATAHEFDDRPGAVRDAIRDAVSAWLALLTAEAGNAGAADSEQFAFELQALAQGANLRYRLFREEAAFAHARTAIARRLASAGDADD